MTLPRARGLLDRSATNHAIRWRRYTAGARVYDAVSLERPIYGVGRRHGIHLLAPRRENTSWTSGAGQA
jgi:hypothetical protein